MKAKPTSIPGVIILEPNLFEDERGFFMETYQAQYFKALGITSKFVQDNHSGSVRGVLRGLHYQIQQPQGKIVRVVQGDVFDVAVDLRRSSRTFKNWVGVVLSAENKKQLWIPPGFAHGFYVLSDWADLLYKVTEYYAPEWDGTIRWDDPELGIKWPLMEGDPPKVSEKDAALPMEILPHFLDVLTFRERKIIEIRYGLNGRRLTLEETGKIVGASKERVRQIEKKAVRRMQHRKWLDDREKAKEGVHAENE